MYSTYKSYTEARSRNYRCRGKKAKRKVHPRTGHEGPEEE